MAASKIDATPGQLNLTLYQGDDFWMNIGVTDPNNNPVNLTGCTPKASVEAQDGSWSALFVSTVSGSTVSLHLSHAVAATLVPGSAVWDVQVTDTNGYVTTLMAGAVTVVPEVTT